MSEWNFRDVPQTLVLLVESTIGWYFGWRGGGRRSSENGWTGIACGNGLIAIMELSDLLSHAHIVECLTVKSVSSCIYA